jgi:hypothetical protein
MLKYYLFFGLLSMRGIATEHHLPSSRVVISLRSNSSINFQMPMAMIDLAPSEMSGSTMIPLAIEAPFNSQVRLSFFPLSFQPEDRVEVTLVPVQGAQSRKLLIWDGKNGVENENFSVQIPKGEHTTSLFLEFKTVKPSPIVREGTLELLLLP